MIFGFDEPDVPEVEAETVKQTMDSKTPCIILDVRTPGEYVRGKLRGSINLPVEQVSNDAERIIPDKNVLVYVYCLSGARSAHAVTAMQHLGYTQVFNMQFGLLGWRAKYFPVE